MSVNIHICVCMHICKYTHKHMCMRRVLHTDTNFHIYTHIHTHTYMYNCIYIYIYMYMYMYIYMYYYMITGLGALGGKVRECLEDLIKVL